MDINNLLLNYINQNIPKENFRENTVFQGEILEIQGDIVFLEIIGKGVIQAESKLDLEDMIGEKIKFAVTNKNDNKIEIKPLIEDSLKDFVDEKDSSILKILKNYNIKETELSRKLIRNLMKYDISLKDDVISEAIKTLDKIIELSEGDYEGLEFINNNIEKLDENTNKLDINMEKKIILNENQNPSSGKLTTKTEIRDLMEGLPSVKKELLIDIKKILVSDNPDKNEMKLGKEIKDIFKKINIEAEEDDLLDIISLLTKNKVKPSINNIKNLKELIEDPIEFAKTFQMLRDKSEIKDIKPVHQRQETMLNKGTEKNKDLDKDIIKNIFDKDIEKLKNFSGNLKKEETIDLKEKIEFIKDLNREIYFHFIPLNVGENKLNGLINIIKDRKREKSFKEGINIFISLDTNNLGNITVSCQAKQDDLNIKIGIDNKDVELFEMKKETLIDRVEILGFKISKLEFTFKDEVNINNSLMLNESPIHFLDIKV